MALTSITLILLSSLFHALWNVLTQTSKNSQFLSGLKGLWIMCGSLGFAVFLDLGSIPVTLWYWIVISGVLHGTYILSLSQAYNSADISYVYPIARSAPVLVPFFAWQFLGEQLGFLSIAAIIMILLAVYILHFDGKLVQGFRNVWNAVIHKDLRWAFITLALVISYSLVDKAGMDVFSSHSPNTPFVNGLAFFFFEAFIGFSLCNLWLFYRHPASEILGSWQLEWRQGLIAGLSTMGSYGLICVVLQWEAVSQVVAVRQVSVLMVVCWGVFKLKEPFGAQRILAAILILMGVAMMAFDPATQH